MLTVLHAILFSFFWASSGHALPTSDKVSCSPALVKMLLASTDRGLDWVPSMPTHTEEDLQYAMAGLSKRRIARDEFKFRESEQHLGKRMRAFVDKDERELKLLVRERFQFETALRDFEEWEVRTWLLLPKDLKGLENAALESMDRLSSLEREYRELLKNEARALPNPDYRQRAFSQNAGERARTLAHNRMQHALEIEKIKIILLKADETYQKSKLGAGVNPFIAGTVLPAPLHFCFDSGHLALAHFVGALACMVGPRYANYRRHGKIQTSIERKWQAYQDEFPALDAREQELAHEAALGYAEVSPSERPDLHEVLLEHHTRQQRQAQLAEAQAEEEAAAAAREAEEEAHARKRLPGVR